MIVTAIDLECPGCGATVAVEVHQHLGATDLIPETCPDCEAELGPAYEEGQHGYF